MLAPELLREIRAVQLKARHVVTTALAGQYMSAFKGAGMEFDRVREYLPGDDVRAIDWNVTARMGQPFIKVYREERELTVMLLVDVSSSQDFTTRGAKTKRDLAGELAAILAFLAIKNSDKVGLVVFADGVETFIPPEKGRAHVWRIIRTVLTHRPKGRGTNLAAALDYTLKMLKRKSLCVLVSDFRDQGYERSLQIASQRHELVCVDVIDERERRWPKVGWVQLTDSETGESVLVDTSDPQVQRALAEQGDGERTERHRLFRKYGVDSFTLTTGDEVSKALITFLRQRENRKAKRSGG